MSSMEFLEFFFSLLLMKYMLRFQPRIGFSMLSEHLGTNLSVLVIETASIAFR